MDPISVVITSLTLGIAAGLKPTAEQAVKDAYNGLKQLIQERYQVNLANLENAPDSAAQKMAVQEVLEKRGAENDVELVTQAEKVVQEVERYAPDTPGTIGVELEDVKAGIVNFKNISVAQGASGVVVRRGEFDELNFGDIAAGGDDSKNV
jgi:hypothetical protein